MATFTEDNNLIETEFKKLKTIYDKIKSISTLNSQLSTLSMGMSADYMIAVASGTTMVRIGSLLFGERNNKP